MLFTRGLGIVPGSKQHQFKLNHNRKIENRMVKKHASCKGSVLFEPYLK